MVVMVVTMIAGVAVDCGMTDHPLQGVRVAVGEREREVGERQHRHGNGVAIEESADGRVEAHPWGERGCMRVCMCV